MYASCMHRQSVDDRRGPADLYVWFYRLRIMNRGEGSEYLAFQRHLFSNEEQANQRDGREGRVRMKEKTRGRR